MYHHETLFEFYSCSKRLRPKSFISVRSAVFVWYGNKVWWKLKEFYNYFNDYLLRRLRYMSFDNCEFSALCSCVHTGSNGNKYLGGHTKNKATKWSSLLTNSISRRKYLKKKCRTNFYWNCLFLMEVNMCGFPVSIWVTMNS